MKKEWFTILSSCEGFNMTEFNIVIIKSCNPQKGLMLYRNQLLKQMKIPDFTQKMTIENLQKWFLEFINKRMFNYIKKLIKENKWTIKELWIRCKNESIGIMTLAKCQNERAF